MPVEGSGLAPEPLLALDRRTRRLLTCSVRRTPSLPRGTLSPSRALNRGRTRRRSLIPHPSLAGGSGAGTHPRDGATKPLSLHAG